MKKSFLIIIFICTVFIIYGQQKITISGFVNDSITKEALIGANIYVPEYNIGTVTNEYGFYSLTIPLNDTVIIETSFIGYSSKKTIIRGSSKNNINILLTSGIHLNEVVVSPTKQDNIVRRNETSVTRIQIKEIKKLPNLFGEVDIIQALQYTPGVQSGGESKSSLYVRGGSPDQNLILLDDVPLYYVGHFGGFFSVFNADAINDVKLIKGGFPAHYGSRLSSVLDIRMKEGNMQHKDIQGTIGLLSSKISISAPILKDKSSFICSVRGNIIPVFRMMGAPLNYNFYDINSKINYILSDNNRIFLSFYKGEDIVWSNIKPDASVYKNKNNTTIKWGNTLGAFRWNHIYNNKLFSNLTISDTYYRYKTQFEYLLENDTLKKDVRNILNTGINDITIKLDYLYTYNPKINFKFGFNSIYHIFTPNDEVYIQEGTHYTNIDTSYFSKTTAIENAIYLENNLRFNLFTSNIGFRLTTYHVGNTGYYSFEPRILLNYIIKDNMSVKYSFSKMNQYVHLLTYSGTGVPNDYWMPTTENVKPESSVQNTLGLSRTIKNGMFEISIESYYKTMNNLITFMPGESFSGNLDSWEKLIEDKGEGENYGIELFFQKMKGKTTGWIGATIAKAERKFDNINNNKPYPFKYDRLFDFSLVFIHQFKKNITLSSTWTYGSGYPITLATEKYELYGEDVFVYDEKNSYKMRDYHRLDIAANFLKKKKWGERIWTISIFNLYNRQNPYYYFYRREMSMVTEGSGTYSVFGDLKLYQRSLFSIFPSFSYSFKF